MLAGGAGAAGAAGAAGDAGGTRAWVLPHLSLSCWRMILPKSQGSLEKRNGRGQVEKTMT